jgi:FkbM family methyltransferase
VSIEDLRPHPSLPKRLRNWLGRVETREHPLRTVSRRLRYEMYKRRGDGLLKEHRIRFDEDLLISVRPEEVVDRGLFLYGIYERAASAVFTAIVQAGMTVVDAGAHIGQYTLLAAKRVGAAGTVLAFEPNPEALNRLKKNIDANNFSDRVTIHPIALGDAPGMLSLHASDDPHNLGGASLMGQSRPTATIDVRVVRLDGVAADGLERLDVIKVDVEGFESRVLAGAEQLVSKHLPVVQFEVNGLTQGPSGWTAPIFESLRHYGYELYGPVERTSRRWGLRRIADGEDPRWAAEEGSPLNLFAVHPSNAARYADLL